MGIFSYKLSPDFKTLTGTLFVIVYPTSEKMKTLVKAKESTDKPLFKTHVSVTEALVNSTNNIKDNAQLWAKDEGAYLRNVMDSLIHRLVLSLETVLKYPQYSPEG